MKIGIIGYGHLGHSLGRGLMRAGISEKAELFICEGSAALAAEKTEKHGIRATDDVNLVIAESELIFLTVKAAVFEALAGRIDQALLKGKTVISFMAGMPLSRLHALLGDSDIVWAMPSIAIASCEGIIGYTAAPDNAAAVLEKLGYAFPVSEEEIGKVMAFASCGLGFAALMLDAFSSIGDYFGFSPEISRRITEQTFRNAMDLGDFRATADAVATPGGATEQGINHMNGQNIHSVMQQAAQKAYDKMK